MTNHDTRLCCLTIRDSFFGNPVLIDSDAIAGDVGFLPGDAFSQYWDTRKSVGDLQTDKSILFRESHAKPVGAMMPNMGAQDIHIQ